MINPIFVGRDTEIKFLETLLEKVIKEQTCQVCLIEGNSGAGKTTLVEKFAQLAETNHSEKNVVVTIGKCNAQTGENDTFLPFREILNQFTGIQAKILRNSINERPPTWFRVFAESALLTLIELGPDLIGTFVPGTALVARLASVTVNSALKKRAESRLGNQEIKKEEVHEQYLAILRKYAKEATTIIIVDDLQWANQSSLDLFVHLAKNLHQSPVLIIGTYRSEDKDKSLITLELDIQTLFGDSSIDLSKRSKQTEKEFTHLFLKENKCQVDDSFYNEFFRRTEGNALFSVELLRYLWEKNLLVQNKEGYWVESPSMSWSKLPTQLARLEGLIDARLETLNPQLREILNIASIEGQDFTAQVIMNFLELSEYELLKILSTELEKKHNLVYEVKETPVGSNVLSNYRFVNATFHQYIYNGMSLGQRRLRHKEVAEALENLYKSNAKDIAFQLVRHYQLSYESKKEVKYLNLAGEHLINMGDLQRAEEVLNRALSLAKTINDKQGKVDSLQNIYGRIKPSQNKNAEAEEQLLVALNLAQQIGYIEGEITVRRQLGILARRKNHFTIATRFYLESLNLAKKLEAEAKSEEEKNAARNSQGSALNNLGLVAMQEGAFDETEKYLNDRLKIGEEVNDLKGIVFAYINLGELFWRKGYISWLEKQEDSAQLYWGYSKNYYTQALEIGHQIGLKVQIANAKLGLATLAIYENNYDEAKKYLFESLTVVESSGLLSRRKFNLICAAQFFCQTNQFEEAAKLAFLVLKTINVEKFEENILKRVIENIETNHSSIYANLYLKTYEEKLKNKDLLIHEQEVLIRQTLDLLKP